MGRFDGAWEETGVIGPRLEIDGDKVIFLWQASVVLETTFKTIQEGGKTVLKLEHNGLRSEGSLDPYAVIKEFYFNGTALVTVTDFRFSPAQDRDLLRPAHEETGLGLSGRV